MSNVDLWKLAEQLQINKWSIFRDTQGNEIIWTGKSFQAYTEVEEKFTGMCLGDRWTFVGIDDSEQ